MEENNGEFKPTKEQEEAVEKAREKLNKRAVKRHERDFFNWREGRY